MKKSLMVLFVAVLAPISNSTFAGDTPRSTAQKYITCLRMEDFRAAYRERIDGGAGIPEKYKDMAPIIMSEARIVRVENVNYSTAIVYISVKTPQGDRITLPMKLVRRNGEWKIANQKF